ncbi:MAG: PRC-barrel domain-containing protein, partial [Pseudomonadota bacterium]
SSEPKIRFVEFDDLIVQPFNISVDRVENRNIYDRSGQKIGEVDEVLFSSDQRIAAISITVGGNVLGFGGREVVVELDQLVMKGVKATIDMTNEEFNQLPTYDD